MDNKTRTTTRADAGKQDEQHRQGFDFGAALSALQGGQSFTGPNGVLTPLIKQLTEAMLNAEIETHLLEQKDIHEDIGTNRRNGYTSKTIKSPSGSFELDTPRDRAGTFEPQLVKKHQTWLSSDMEEKIISLFSLGMSYRDISANIMDLYGLEVSTATMTSVTDKLIPALEAWQTRPLEKTYPIVWLDAVHYKVKDNAAYVHRAVYTVLGLDMNGQKDILGLYLSETEGANFWLSVLSDLHHRGIEDILIACVDGLKGFPEAITTIFPKTEVQLCIIHQIRNSLRYVASKNHKEFMADLKPVYKAMTKREAEIALDTLEKKWGKKYPIVLKSWRDKWENLSAYFRYHDDIRRVIYTTNAVEAVHRQFRKLTKTKGAFPNETSLLKLLYAGIGNARKKWTMPVQNWNLTLSQLSIHFNGRLDTVINF